MTSDKISESDFLEKLNNKEIHINEKIKVYTLELPLLHYALFKDYFLLFKKIISIDTLNEKDSIQRSAFEFALLLGKPKYINYILNNFEVNQFDFFPYWCVKTNQIDLLKQYAHSFDLNKKYYKRTLIEHVCLMTSKASNYQEMFLFLQNYGVKFTLQKNENSFLQFLIQHDDTELLKLKEGIKSIIYFDTQQLSHKNELKENCLHTYLKFINDKAITSSSLQFIQYLLTNKPDLVLELDCEGKKPLEVFNPKNTYNYFNEVRKHLIEIENYFVEKKQLENLILKDCSYIDKKKNSIKL